MKKNNNNNIQSDIEIQLLKNIIKGKLLEENILDFIYISNSLKEYSNEKILEFLYSFGFKKEMIDDKFIEEFKRSMDILKEVIFDECCNKQKN